MPRVLRTSLVRDPGDGSVIGIVPVSYFTFLGPGSYPACWSQAVEKREGLVRWAVAARPRIRHAFISEKACRLNLQEAWWRIFRRQALAGQDFTDPDEITCATKVATARLNARARPWVWGRPQPRHRYHRRRFVYTL